MPYKIGGKSNEYKNRVHHIYRGIREINGEIEKTQIVFNANRTGQATVWSANKKIRTWTFTWLPFIQCEGFDKEYKMKGEQVERVAITCGFHSDAYSSDYYTLLDLHAKHLSDQDGDCYIARDNRDMLKEYEYWAKACAKGNPDDEEYAELYQLGIDIPVKDEEPELPCGSGDKLAFFLEGGYAPEKRGVVYIARTAQAPIIKIGMSGDLEGFKHRMTKFKGDGYKGNLFEPYFAVEVNGYKRLEKVLHSVFSPQRIGDSEGFHDVCLDTVVGLLTLIPDSEVILDRRDEWDDASHPLTLAQQLEAKLAKESAA